MEGNIQRIPLSGLEIRMRPDTGAVQAWNLVVESVLEYELSFQHTVRALSGYNAARSKDDNLPLNFYEKLCGGNCHVPSMD